MDAITGRYIYAIYFVGFDDEEVLTSLDTSASDYVEPFVAKERIFASTDSHSAWADVQLSVLARGGKLLTICADDEHAAEQLRVSAEAEIFGHK